MIKNKRFKLAFENFDEWAICDTTGEYSNDEDYIDWLSGQKAVDVLNHFSEENEQLKAQLYCDDEEGVCNICKHHFLVPDDETVWGYYNSRCKKGHYECARISLKHCKDFELKGWFK